MIVQVPLEKVMANPWQTRKPAELESEYIVELAEDIQKHGMMQMPRGRALRGNDVIELDRNQGVVESSFQNDDNLTVQLCFGHNRLAAYKRLFGFHGDVFGKMPVDIYLLSDEQMAVLAWSENEKRREHTAMERAHAIQDRMASFGWNHAEVAEKLGVARSTVSNALRLFKLPEEAQKALDEGTISERVGMALVSLFDLPEEMRDAAEKFYYFTQRPSWIVKEALKGSITSDEVRSKIEDICRENGRRLEAADWSLDEEFSIPNVTTPACRECEKRDKKRNICLLPLCFEFKKAETHRSYLEAAGKECGIKPLEGEKYAGYGMTTSFSNFHNKEHLEAVKASKCENLRLMFVSGKKAGEDQSQVKGFPKAFIVCGKREQFCTCLKGLEYSSQAGSDDHRPAPMHVLGEEEEELVRDIDGLVVLPDGTRVEAEQGYSAEELKELARVSRREKRDANKRADEITREVGKKIAVGLASGNLKTWKYMAEKINYSLTGGSVSDIQNAIGVQLAVGNLPYTINTIGDIMLKMNALLESCGLEELGERSEEAAQEVVVEEQVADEEKSQIVPVF